MTTTRPLPGTEPSEPRPQPEPPQPPQPPQPPERAALPPTFSAVAAGLRDVDLARVLRTWNPEDLAIAVHDADDALRDRICAAIRLYAEERVRRFLRELEEQRAKAGPPTSPGRPNRESERLVRYTRKLIEENEICTPAAAPPATAPLGVAP